MSAPARSEKETEYEQARSHVAYLSESLDGLPQSTDRSEAIEKMERAAECLQHHLRMMRWWELDSTSPDREPGGAA